MRPPPTLADTKRFALGLVRAWRLVWRAAPRLTTANVALIVLQSALPLAALRRLFDAVVGWGPEDEIAQKVRLHHEAGADHVAVQVLTPTPDRAPLDDLRRLAPLITG